MSDRLRLDNTFIAQFTELCPGRAELGSVALLPWDIQIFGFSVGEYRCGGAEALAKQWRAAMDAHAKWADGNDVELCACSVPATDWGLIALLPRFGYTFVDSTLRVSLPALQAAAIPPAPIRVWHARPDEFVLIAAIAEHSFQTGRYHADARFPGRLADLRYRRWMERAATSADASTFVYVVRDQARVRGFCHVTVDGGVADLRLAAVDASLRGSPLGFYLYTGTLCALKQAGVTRVVSKISCANTAVMNIYAALGFRFSEPEVVFHWHAPGARHLLGVAGLANA